MTLPPREVGRRLDQQAHDIEDAYGLLTELRTETAAGFARVDERLDLITGQLAQVEPRFAQFSGRLEGVDGRLDHHGQLLERILHLLDKPGT